MSEQRTVSYAPAGPVVKAFHESEAFVRGLMGPIGSGKSTACVIELLRRAQMQRPGPDGVRRSRWAIIRNSYPELRSTTLKTWAEWCPLSFGKYTMDSPIVHRIQTPDLDAEFLFMALDKPEDARKLLSLELTGAWINEAREVEKSILDAFTGRVGRYPGKLQGGCTWSGIVMDTNPPDAESWWFRLAETETPGGWQFFRQPSGLSPTAENIENLPRDYYKRSTGGKDPDWVKVYVHGDYGFVTEGSPVFPQYRDSVHCSPERIDPVPDVPLLLGADFGLTPACVIGQKLVDGRWLILDELVTDDMGVTRFAEMLGSYIARNYPEHKVGGAWGDPAGNQRAFSDERTALDIMSQHTGWRWRPAPTNAPEMRLEVVRGTLNRMVDGEPGLLLSPKCQVLRKGFAGGYCRRFVKASGSAQLHEQPAKNSFSHPHDALQYLLLGGGEHNVVLNRVQRSRNQGPRIARDVDYDVFASRRSDYDIFPEKNA